MSREKTDGLNEAEDRFSWWRKHWPWVAATCSYAFVAAIWFWTKYGLQDDAQRGTFGDMFGGTNALFSGLAFATLIITALLQGAELRLQRQELADTRAVMKQQVETLEQQRFEGTFFSMLNMFRSLLGTLRVQSESGVGAANDGSISGVFAVSELTGALLKLDAVQGFVPSRPLEPAGTFVRQKICDRFDGLAASVGAVVRPYTNALIALLSLIDEARVEDKDFYASIVRACQSEEETRMLFYWSLTDRATARSRHLVEKFAMLTGLTGIPIEHQWAASGLLDREAFEYSQ